MTAKKITAASIEAAEAAVRKLTAEPTEVQAADDDATEPNLAVAEAFDRLRETAKAMRDARVAYEAANKAARAAERAKYDATDVYQGALNALDDILRGYSPPPGRPYDTGYDSRRG